MEGQHEASKIPSRLRPRAREGHRRAALDPGSGGVGQQRVAAGSSAVLAVAAIVARLPAPAAAWLGRRLGDLARLVLPRRRHLVDANLAVAFPELPSPARRQLARRSWQHLGLTFVELCGALAVPLDRVLEGIVFEGLEHVRRAMETHGRALVLTAHLGNWELLTAAHRLTGYPLTVVVRPLDARWLDTLAERLRRKADLELVDKRGALRPVLQALGDGRLVAILLDQNATRREGVFVPFFGRPASTSKSLAMLAVRTGAPVVPIFIRREQPGRHRVTAQPALPMPDTRNRERAILELTSRCASVVEEAIRRAPDQWLWAHDRWRTRPAGPEGATV